MKILSFLIILFANQALSKEPDISKLDPNKYNVCTITINSSEEKEVFKERLPKDKFQFIELLDYAEDHDPSYSSSNQWFEKACKSGLNCHMLIISGHFGGDFFGSSGKTLSSAYMERKSCENSCTGIFNSPKEVFLFGCNTLAGKDKDSRSPEEYLEVLLSDRDYMNVDRSTLEGIVEARYGSFGSEFKDVMTRTFEGVPRLYGFSSIGPSGKNVKGLLKNYFTKMGNYGTYYSSKFGPPTKDKNSLSEEKLKAQLKELEKSNFFNGKLSDALKVTAFTQCSGLLPNDPAYKIKQRMCQLHSDKLSNLEKMKLIEELLQDENKLAFFPLIEDFLTTKVSINDLKSSDCEECKVFQRIISNNKLKEDLIVAIKAVNVPTLKSEWIKFAHAVGWIDPKTLKEESRKVLLRLLKSPVTRDNLDSLYSLPNLIFEVSDITEEDLDSNFAKSKTDIEALGILWNTSNDFKITTKFKDSVVLQYMNFKGDPEEEEKDYFSSLEELVNEYRYMGFLDEDKKIEAFILSKKQAIEKYFSNDDESSKVIDSWVSMYGHFIASGVNKYPNELKEIVRKDSLTYELYTSVQSLDSSKQKKILENVLEVYNQADENLKFSIADHLTLNNFGQEAQKEFVDRFSKSSASDQLILSRTLPRISQVQLSSDVQKKMFDSIVKLNEPNSKLLANVESQKKVKESLRDYFLNSYRDKELTDEECRNLTTFAEKEIFLLEEQLMTCLNKYDHLSNGILQSKKVIDALASRFGIESKLTDFLQAHSNLVSFPIQEKIMGDRWFLSYLNRQEYMNGQKNLSPNIQKSYLEWLLNSRPENELNQYYTLINSSQNINPGAIELLSKVLDDRCLPPNSPKSFCSSPELEKLIARFKTEKTGALVNSLDDTLTKVKNRD